MATLVLRQCLSFSLAQELSMEELSLVAQELKVAQEQKPHAWILAKQKKMMTIALEDLFRAKYAAMEYIKTRAKVRAGRVANSSIWKKSTHATSPTCIAVRIATP